MNYDQSELNVQLAYAKRFGGIEKFRNEMWALLCRDVFQKYITPDDTVLEIAAGYCEFINNIRAKCKIAVDLNEDVKKFANPGVKVCITSSENLEGIDPESVDVVWVSNFFEHIDKPTIVRTLRGIHGVLKKEGVLLVLQPNIRFVGMDYWMFYDHITPLCDRSLCEVIENSGFMIKECIPRFLPYSTKSKLPKNLFLIRLYLKLPFLWNLFGGQTFVVAKKS